jgi:hypothetical protein
MRLKLIRYRQQPLIDVPALRAGRVAELGTRRRGWAHRVGLIWRLRTRSLAFSIENGVDALRTMARGSTPYIRT